MKRRISDIEEEKVRIKIKMQLIMWLKRKEMAAIQNQWSQKSNK